MMKGNQQYHKALKITSEIKSITDFWILVKLQQYAKKYVCMHTKQICEITKKWHILVFLKLTYFRSYF